MTPIIYASNETNFSTLGQGLLTDCISCPVTEEVESGKYECEFSYPITGQNYSLIVPDKIVKVKPNDTANPQLFRIYKTTKPINGIVKFYCQHMSYDLCLIPVQPIGFLSNVSQNTLFAQIKNKYKLPDNSALVTLANRFTFTNYQATKNKTIVGETPRSVRSWLGGGEGSVLDVYGGEFEFDNFDVKLHETRGNDNGVRITYGKNLTNLSADYDIQGTYTDIYAYAVDGSGRYHETTDLVSIPNSGTYGESRTLILNLSDQYENEDTITESDLILKAQAYAEKYKLNQPVTSISVSFVRLAESKEFETLSQLEKVSIGDTVTVEYPALGVSSTLRVVKTVYDSLNEKYISIELGKAKQTIVKMLSSVSKEVENVVTTQQTAMQAAASYAAQKITGGMGGCVVIKPNASTGYPEEILIMDNPDISQAVKVWRWNSGGLGHSNNGYDSQSYNIALTDDGQINASAITTGYLSANRIKTGTMTNQSNTLSIDLDTSMLRIKENSSGSVFTGTTQIGSGGVVLEDDNGANKVNIFIQHNNEPVIRIHDNPLVEFGDKNNPEFVFSNHKLTVKDEYITGELNVNSGATLKVHGYTFQPVNLTINGSTYTLLGVL